MPVKKIAISLELDDLEIIDQAAEAARESRSEYLRTSALARAEAEAVLKSAALSETQRDEIAEMIRRARL